MALSADLLLRNHWLHGTPKQRRPGASSVKAAKVLYLGGVAMEVDGVAEPVLSGSSLVAVCTTIAGADANGGVVLRARKRGVTVQFAGGTSKTLGVTSITYGATIAILIQQGTDGTPVVTNTAEQMCNLIRGHAELNKLLACKATGTGAGLTATAAATAIKHLSILGVPTERYTAPAGAVLDLRSSDVFDIGCLAMAGASGAVPTVLNSLAYLVDDAQVKSTADPLDFAVVVKHIEDGRIFVDLCEAQ